MHYNISQYLEGRKLKKPKIISKTLKKRLISSKFNIMKNHEIIPKNHLSHLDKIIE